MENVSRRDCCSTGLSGIMWLFLLFCLVLKPTMHDYRLIWKGLVENDELGVHCSAYLALGSRQHE